MRELCEVAFLTRRRGDAERRRNAIRFLAQRRRAAEEISYLSLRLGVSARGPEFMTKDQIIEVLENIGRLLELKDENAFKVRAYVNGARALETMSEDLDVVIEEGRLGKVDGIGKALEEKITTLHREGKLEYYDDLRAEFPADIFTLFELRGIGAKKIKVLFDELGVSSISSLQRACEDGRVAGLEGFGEKSAENFLKAIAARRARGSSRWGRSREWRGGCWTIFVPIRRCCWRRSREVTGGGRRRCTIWI